MSKFRALIDAELKKKERPYLEFLKAEIELIRKARDAKISYSKISKFLNAEGFKSTPAQVREFCLDSKIEGSKEVPKLIKKRRRNKPSQLGSSTKPMSGIGNKQKMPVIVEKVRAEALLLPRSGFRAPLGEDL